MEVHFRKKHIISADYNLIFAKQIHTYRAENANFAF